MNEPWPDDVFDCAVRLARSLGYEERDTSHRKGRVYVFCAEQSDCFTEKISELYNTPVTPLWAIFDGNWRELDPRDPTVWSALIGPHGVGSLFYWKSNYVCPGRYSDRASYHPGLAVCEAYNALKGNPRWVND
jgi:hypothetical protein